MQRRRGRSYFQFTASLCRAALPHFVNKKYPKACGGLAVTPGDNEGLQRMLLPVYAPIVWGSRVCSNNLSTDDAEQG